jgi:hypothetical protein
VTSFFDPNDSDRDDGSTAWAEDRIAATRRRIEDLTVRSDHARERAEHAHDRADHSTGVEQVRHRAVEARHHAAVRHHDDALVVQRGHLHDLTELVERRLQRDVGSARRA